MPISQSDTHTSELKSIFLALTVSSRISRKIFDNSSADLSNRSNSAPRKPMFNFRAFATPTVQSTHDQITMELSIQVKTHFSPCSLSCERQLR